MTHRTDVIEYLYMYATLKTLLEFVGLCYMYKSDESDGF